MILIEKKILKNHSLVSKGSNVDSNSPFSSKYLRYFSSGESSPKFNILVKKAEL